MGITIHDRTPKVYMVTGCHNSATSLLALGLGRCGINIGEHLAPLVYEDWEFMALNDSILLEAGGDWANPPDAAAIMAVDADKRIAALVADREDSPAWAFKDPRTALTGRLYLPHLAHRDAYLFCAFRRPERVVASLQRKGRQLGVEGQMTRALVDRYNRAALDLARAFCELEA